MDVISAFAVGLSLAADAMAVAICCGIKSRVNYRKNAVCTGAMFGFFQMLMSVLGWSIGKVGLQMIAGKESIVSFVILLLLGIKMVLDSRKEPTLSFQTINFKELLLFSIATSIDALAIGTVLPTAVCAYTGVSLLFAILIIGAVTFVLSYLGFRLGNRFDSLRPNFAGSLGGIVLILLGFKILIFG